MLCADVRFFTYTSEEVGGMGFQCRSCEGSGFTEVVGYKLSLSNE